MWWKKKKTKQSASLEEINDAVKLLANIAYNSNPPNYNSAFTQYKLAAEEGNDMEAQYNLASMYATGRGTEVNYLLAAYWFNKAANQGDEKAETMVTKATLDYFNGNIEKWSPNDIHKALTDYYKLLYDEVNTRCRAKDLLEELADYYYNKGKNNYANKCIEAIAKFENE